MNEYTVAAVATNMPTVAATAILATGLRRHRCFCSSSYARAHGGSFADALTAFEAIVMNRSSARAFDSSRRVEPHVLSRILALTLRSPSSYNLQPYRIICVQSDAARARLSAAMLGGGNVARVQSAPLVAVFAADLQPTRRLEELTRIEKAAGKPPVYISRMHTHVNTLAQANPVSNALSSSVFSLLSTVTPMPTVNSIEAWSFKSTMLAVQTFMLACSSAGVDTHAMEGFDAAHVRAALRVPCSYAVPVVVAAGYAKATDSHAAAAAVMSPRFDPTTMIAVDDFDVTTAASHELAREVQRCSQQLAHNARLS